MEAEPAARQDQWAPHAMQAWVTAKIGGSKTAKIDDFMPSAHKTPPAKLTGADAWRALEQMTTGTLLR